ncbi:hypothetical protein T12_4230 [Trichinella patagoniensis]|uniref:Uncharacterized protein n=1 Tax=Trichinella patagoniensis TaxID=990121 RepID=A0A0V0YT98_9BILA|nr:hypothetical protein T12_4230 [Trichinella patagoniensis]
MTTTKTFLGSAGPRSTSGTLSISDSQTFLGCDPLWTTISFRDPPACNAFLKGKDIYQ